MNNFVPCRICGKKKGPMPGYYYDKPEGFDREVVIECPCHVQWREERDLDRRCTESGVWNRDYNPMEDYKGDKSTLDRDALCTFANNPEIGLHHMVYIYGLNGTQKTTLSMWLARSLIKKGYRVIYTLMETLSNSLTPDFNDTTGVKEAFVERCLKADFLFIDESFDKKKMTLYKSGYQIPFIDKFIRERFDIGRKNIIFISNVKSSDIDADFGTNLGDLVRRNTLNSSLTFLDKYINEANKIDPRGLFK